MDRLSDGAIEIINDLHKERLEYNSEYIPLIDAAKRLSDYEDIGILPEEIKAILGDGGVGLAIRNRDLRTNNEKLNTALTAIRKDLQEKLPQLKKLQELMKAAEKPPEPVAMCPIPHEEKLRLIDEYLYGDGRINDKWASMIAEYRSLLKAQHGPEV